MFTAHIHTQLTQIQQNTAQFSLEVINASHEEPDLHLTEQNKASFTLSLHTFLHNISISPAHWKHKSGQIWQIASQTKDPIAYAPQGHTAVRKK
jgi:hypothetical protein